ncbi:MAG: hypothetical protein V8Q27_01315 [Eubacteriales bacterium]
MTGEEQPKPNLVEFLKIRLVKPASPAHQISGADNQEHGQNRIDCNTDMILHATPPSRSADIPQSRFCRAAADAELLTTRDIG